MASFYRTLVELNSLLFSCGVMYLQSGTQDIALARGNIIVWRVLATGLLWSISPLQHIIVAS